MSANSSKVPAIEGCFSTIGFNSQLQCLYIDNNFNVSALASDSGISNWVYQDVSALVTDPVLADSYLCALNYCKQLHHFYITSGMQIADIYYDLPTEAWHYQNLHQLQETAPAAKGPLFAVTYNTQQHNLYISPQGAICDIWYDSSTEIWQSQNLNELQSQAPKFAHSLKVIFCNNQLHHLYIDQNQQISDIWHDWTSNTWHYENLSQCNNTAPLAGDELAAISINNCLHTIYVDANGDLGYILRDFAANTWQYQNLSTAVTNPPKLRTGLSVCYYMTQLHVTYIDYNSDIIDIFNDTSGQWYQQNVSSFQSTAPQARGELCPSPYGNECHYIYIDMNNEISDIYYDGSGWNYQNIGNLPSMQR